MTSPDFTHIFGDSSQRSQLFIIALTHKSFANENSGTMHNERLEFLGDAVLELAVTKYLFEHFPREPEGKMTKYRSALVSGISLATVAKKLHIGQHIRLSRGEAASGGKDKNPILANVFEALIGALFLEQGMLAVEQLLDEYLFPRLSEVVEKHLYVDPKSGFQEWAQEALAITPEYRVFDESGLDHDKTFRVGVFVTETQMGEGEGSSKQKAEVAAAENALARLVSLSDAEHQ